MHYVSTFLVFSYLLPSYFASFQFRVSNSLAGESGYKQNEIIDWTDEGFETFVKNSLPVPEKTEKEAFYTTFPTDYAFVVRNVQSVDYFNLEDECYDPFGKFLFDYSKTKGQRRYLQNLFDYYHIHSSSEGSRVSSEACLPFVGKRNDVDRGYWNALSANMTTLTPAHSDRSSNFIWCASGTKYVFLWSSEDYQNLYMDDFFHSTNSGSERTIRFRLENVDLLQFPKYAKATRYVVKLGPNDVLHMPLKWIHHVFTEPGSFCLNMWFQEKTFDDSFKPVKNEDVTMHMALSNSEQHGDDMVAKSQRWHWTNDAVGLRLALANNNLVKIKNAFRNPERFHLHDKEEEMWEEEVGTRHDGIEWYKRDICKSCSKAFRKEIRDLFPFFTQLLQVPIGKMSGRGTRYRNGHYLESHTDATMDRVLSIVYHITPPEKWNRTCGGELEWHGSSMYQEAQPSYNTLYLFLPRAEFSSHRIKPTRCGERFSYAGWLLSNETTPNYLSLLHSHEFKLRNPAGNIWEVEDEGNTPAEEPPKVLEENYEGSKEERQEIEEMMTDL